MARGGTGGKGNYQFRSATNQQPKSSKGHQTEYKKLFTIKTYCSGRLSGLPNAGKSTLLNELTNAHAKTANYQFTTLEPNLGVMKNVRLLPIFPDLSGSCLRQGFGCKIFKTYRKH